MRLDKLKIGSDRPGEKQHFKNLKNVEIDFDENEWVTVVIGWNGTGKSNVLEALAIIFRNLIGYPKKDGKQDDPIPPEFSFEIIYQCHGKLISIVADPDGKNRSPYSIAYAELTKENVKNRDSFLDETAEDIRLKKISYADFKKRRDEFLPKYVFGYYSGQADRMYKIFLPYLDKYDEKLRNAKSEDPGLRRLFYALPIHSQFVLLAFILRQDDLIKNFLDKQLGLDVDENTESIDSALIVLNEPPWNRNKSSRPTGEYNAWKENPDIFWGAEGVVRVFLDRVLPHCTAPIKLKRDDNSIRFKSPSREYLYLYLKDLERLDKVIGEQTPREFFRDVESTYVSELIKEIRVRVKLKKNDGSVTFRELSEGEQQLLTVLGLLRFTAEEESLFLLDEPDTHLNPRWSVDYIGFLNDFIKSSYETGSSSHVVLTTHNPIAIAELKKEQVQILHHVGDSRNVRAVTPEQDPRGMGYGGVVTSDLFGLGSSLDKYTTNELLKLHKLSNKKSQLTEDEKLELSRLRTDLEKLDFNFASDDRLEREFTRARFDLSMSDEEFESPILTHENREKALDALVRSLLEDIEKDHS